MSVERPFEMTVQRDMRDWMERAVIALNLCPFAKTVHVRGLVHYAVSDASSPVAVLPDLLRELVALSELEANLRDTTLLMMPYCLDEFLEFNDFLTQADEMLRDLHLDGVIQIASFHPDFEFGDSAPGDISNCTNRAPYPTLHLLREASIDRAVEVFPQADAIYERNIQTLRQLGHKGWEALGIRRSLPKHR
ncbi:MAG: DUF1415 domain-containing protein [Burkholderiaceae bacterium]